MLSLGSKGYYVMSIPQKNSDVKFPYAIPESKHKKRVVDFEPVNRPDIDSSIYRFCTNYLAIQCKHGPAMAAVFGQIYFHCGKTGHSWASHATIATECGINPKTVLRCAEKLIKLKLLKKLGYDKKERTVCYAIPNNVCDVLRRL